MSDRKPIPRAVQDEVLLANRHACCVCQKQRVQIHHIDSDPTNNDPGNLATLCLDHHDRATMTAGLTKKLTPEQVREYKRSWEAKCAADVTALARRRFTFYYCIYKNPPRIRETYLSLRSDERDAAAGRLIERLSVEQPLKDKDELWGYNAVPSLNDWTKISLHSILKAETYPSYLDRYEPHPEDPEYFTETKSQEAMHAFHLLDLWYQVAAQTLAEARGTLPLEDLFNLKNEEDFDHFAGRLVTFKLSVRGKNIRIPRLWREQPVGTVTASAKREGRNVKVRMQVRTMYLFSDTAAINLERGRVSGLGMFSGALVEGGNVDLTVIPLLIGTGGWNLYGEHYPEEFRS